MSIKGQISGARLTTRETNLVMVDRLVEARCAKLRHELERAKAHNSRLLRAVLKSENKRRDEKENHEYYFRTVCQQRDEVRKQLTEMENGTAYKAMKRERDRYRKALGWITITFTAGQMRKMALDALRGKKV